MVSRETLAEARPDHFLSVEAAMALGEKVLAKLDLDRKLSDVLQKWHAWQKASDRGVRGYSRSDPVVGDFRGYGLQYDAQQEAEYDKADARRSRQVDHEVRELPQPYQMAIYNDAKNLYTGIEQWSPYLPGDPAERAKVVALGREKLAKRLQSAGIL